MGQHANYIIKKSGTTKIYSLLICLLIQSMLAQSQSVPLVDSLTQLLQKNIIEEEQKLSIYNQLAYQFHTSDSTQAIFYAQKAIALSHILANSKEKGEGYKRLGLTHGYYGNSQKAIAYYDTAYLHFQAIPDTNSMIRILNNQGRQLANVGQYEKAIQGYQQAESWLSIEQDSFLLLILQFNHAACLSAAQQHPQTIDFCRKVLPLAFGLDNWYIQMELYSLQGISYTELAEYQPAEIAFNRAFKCIPRATLPVIGANYTSSNPDLESNILNNRALLYIEQNAYEKAYTDLKLAIEILENVDAKHPNGEFYVNLGIATQKMQRFTESEAYFKTGLEKLRLGNQVPLIGETYGYLADLYKETGQGILAHDYLKLAHQIQDSLLSESTQKNLQELHIKYETAKFRQELADTQLQIQAQQHQFSLLLAGIIGLFLLSGLLYYFYYIKQQSRLLALEKKQVELQYGLLRAQMNPHFIFNALNSIHGFFASNQLIRGNEFMGNFSKLVRQILDQSNIKSHLLSKELDTLRLYLDIEKERMDGDMDYTITLSPEVEEDTIELPPLIFQPFVENAVWHGIAPKKEKGHIWINLKMENDHELFCQIKDNGVGLTQKEVQLGDVRTSKGVQITKERLGERGTLSIKNNSTHSGVTVSINILID